jgi:hypothetical protein
MRQVQGSTDLYGSLKIPLPSDAATRMIKRGNAETIASIVRHSEDPEVLVVAARQNRSVAVRSALVARAEYCPPELHARLLQWSLELGLNQTSIEKIVTTMSPEEITSHLEKIASRAGLANVAPPLLRAIDHVFTSQATRADLDRYLNLGRLTIAGVSTILSEALSDASPLLSRQELYRLYHFPTIVNMFTPSTAPLSLDLALAVNELFSRGGATSGVFARLFRLRSDPALRAPIEPDVITALVNGPIPNEGLAKHLYHDDGFMDAVLPMIPDDLDLLIELCTVVTREPDDTTSARRYVARQRRFVAPVASALIERLRTARRDEIEVLATSVAALLTRGSVSNVDDILTILECSIREQHVTVAMAALLAITKVDRNATAAQVRRFNAAMVAFETSDPERALWIAPTRQAALMFERAIGPLHAVWRDYWLRTTPVRFVLTENNTSHLRSYASVLESAFHDNAELWSLFSTLSINWEGALPELVDTVTSMYRNSDQFVKSAHS